MPHPTVHGKTAAWPSSHRESGRLIDFPNIISKRQQMTAPGKIAQEQLWRANIYGLLGIVLAQPPSPETLEQIKRIDVADGNAQHSIMEEAWLLLKNAAATEPHDKIREEYDHLFVGVTSGEITPYASWYLTGFLMEKPLASIRSDLAQLGIERKQSVKEPEDHAAALCEVMRLLILDNDDRQSSFFSAHLAPWIERFFSDLKAIDKAEFYAAVGLLGHEFFRFEQEYFRLVP